MTIRDYPLPMKDYSKEIINNIDTYFIVVNDKGKIISHSDNAPSFLGVRDIVGKHIEHIADMIPGDIWKEEIENVEILWSGKTSKHYEHFIFQSIPFKEGYILCFRESKPPEILITDISYEYSLYDIPGISKEIIEKARKGARGNKPLLIIGESGVGKEVLARAIHKQSKRKGHFVPVNCTSIPRELAESELFGYEPGAFTGAMKTGMPGKFELADGGTIFLDEIGDMPYELQGKLLRVIEDKEIWRVGSTKGKKVDFKVICATHQNIKKLVEKKAFRKDLYHRISGIEIHLPPLKERMEYFDKLVEYFLNKHGGEWINFTDEAKGLLKNYPWPGNIRELEMVIEFLIMEKEGSKDEIIRIEDLPEKIREPEEKIPETLQEKIEALKKKEIKKALEKHNGNKTKAAEELGISRRGLTKMLKRLKLGT